MTYFIHNFLTTCFGWYCGHLQGYGIITRIQRYCGHRQGDGITRMQEYKGTRLYLCIPVIIT